MSKSDSPGPQLRAARERLGLSASEVATTLKVPPAVVVNIEDEQFDALPPRVFTRAYLRNYAELVELDPRALLWAYDKKVDPEAIEEVEARRSSAVLGLMASFARDVKLHRRQSWVFGGTVVLFIALAGVFVWLAWPSDVPVSSATAEEPNPASIGDAAPPASSASDADTAVASVRDPNGPPPNDAIARSEPRVSDSPPVSDQDGSPSGSLDSASADAADLPNVPPGDQPDAVSNGPEEEMVVLSNPLTYVPGEEHVLVFHFTQDCWVEVVDATGASLHGDLERAGNHLEVRGEAPFTLTLGYAPGVQLEYNGESVMLAQHTNDNDVAGLVIGL